MSRPIGAIAGGYHGRKTFKRHIPVVYPHAILSADKQVLGIKRYPLTINSVAVVLIPENVKVQVGDYYNPSNRTFHKEPPNA